jgi:hypothetical protein
LQSSVRQDRECGQPTAGARKKIIVQME